MQLTDFTLHLGRRSERAAEERRYAVTAKKGQVLQ